MKHEVLRIDEIQDFLAQAETVLQKLETELHRVEEIIASSKNSRGVKKFEKEG